MDCKNHNDYKEFKYCPDCGKMFIKKSLNDDIKDILTMDLKKFQIYISGIILERPQFSKLYDTKIGKSYKWENSNESRMVAWTNENYKTVLEECYINYYDCKNIPLSTVNDLLLVLLKNLISKPLFIKPCIIALAGDRIFFRQNIGHEKELTCSHKTCEEEKVYAVLNQIPTKFLYYSKYKNKIYFRKDLADLLEYFSEFIEINLDDDVTKFKIADIEIFILNEIFDNLFKINDFVSTMGLSKIKFKKADPNNISKLFCLNIE